MPSRSKEEGCDKEGCQKEGEEEGRQKGCQKEGQKEGEKEALVGFTSPCHDTNEAVELPFGRFIQFAFVRITYAGYSWQRRQAGGVRVVAAV